MKAEGETATDVVGAGVLPALEPQFPTRRNPRQPGRKRFQDSAHELPLGISTRTAFWQSILGISLERASQLTRAGRFGARSFHFRNPKQHTQDSHFDQI